RTTSGHHEEVVPLGRLIDVRRDHRPPRTTGLEASATRGYVATVLQQAPTPRRVDSGMARPGNRDASVPEPPPGQALARRDGPAGVHRQVGGSRSPQKRGVAALERPLLVLRLAPVSRTGGEWQPRLLRGCRQVVGSRSGERFGHLFAASNAVLPTARYPRDGVRAREVRTHRDYFEEGQVGAEGP